MVVCVWSHILSTAEVTATPVLPSSSTAGGKLSRNAFGDDSRHLCGGFSLCRYPVYLCRPRAPARHPKQRTFFCDRHPSTGVTRSTPNTFFPSRGRGATATPPRLLSRPQTCATPPRAQSLRPRALPLCALRTLRGGAPPPPLVLLQWRALCVYTIRPRAAS